LRSRDAGLSFEVELSRDKEPAGEVPLPLLPLGEDEWLPVGGVTVFFFPT